METITGIVKNIIYESQQNDFKVFVIKRPDNSLIRVTGDFTQILSGAKLEVHGDFKSHPKYGPAFKATAHTFCYDKNTSSISLYIQMIAKWVGPVRSYAIAEKFGGDLQDVIEKTPERLMEIEGIGEKVAESIVEAWKLNRDMKDIQIFLYGLGLGVAKVRRITNMFGPDTEKILTENPWMLCGHGFGFTTCDNIAHKLGRDMRDPFRYQQFINYTMNQVVSTGHLYLHPAQIVEAFNRYNAKADYPFKGGDLTIHDIAVHIKTLIQTAYLLNDNNRIYSLSSFFFENESARLISKILNTKSSCKLNAAEADAYIKRYEENSSIGLPVPFKLSVNQIEAVRSFFSEKVMIMTGGPGTGKTQTVKAFVQVLREKGISFELLTPTGIAAKKLGNATGGEAYTIHRRLGYKGSTWDSNSANKYSTDVIIIDECSMVDQEVFYRLISAIYPSTKIVFVGDNDQLPSVGPGCVLRELIDSKLIKTIFLDKIFRQDKCSEIILESKKIRDGDIDLTYFRSEPTSDIWHIADKDDTRIENTIISFAKQLKNRAKEKHNISFQIITPRNEGPLSVFSLNAALQKALNPPDPNKSELRIDESIIRVGDRVLIKKNNYEHEVFNGDVGKVISITPSSVVVDIEDFMDKSKRIDLPINLAEDMLKLAYVITVHKSQGSEYSIVILPLIKAHGTMLLQRNLLYTAITRAKKKVILIGQTSAIEQAIRNDKIQKRNTVLSERINKWMSGTGISMRNIFSQLGISQSNEILERLLSLEEGSK